MNSDIAIREIKEKMEELQVEGMTRNWKLWKQLKKDLDEEYKKEEIFWQQKSRVQWLREGDRNTNFFHAHTMQKRKKNCIERLIDDQGKECKTAAQLEEKSQAATSNCALRLN